MIRFFILCILILSGSTSVFALNIFPTEGNDNGSAKLISETHTLLPTAANDSGISINQFSSFDLQGNYLRIANIKNPAETIVLIAPSFLISSDIQLVGKSAEILFISADIDCNTCSFLGFPRVSLVGNNNSNILQKNATFIGKIPTTPNSKVNIKDLYTPDSLFFEAIADTIIINGTNSTNQKVSKSPEGGYITDKNGPFTLGGGSVNLIIGQNTWDYESHSVINSSPTNTRITVGGSLNSSEVKVFSSRPTTIRTSINNRVDILASAQYRGEVVVPSGGTSLISTSPYGIDLDSAHIVSDSIIDVRSSGLVNFKQSHLVSNDIIKTIAVREISNSGTLSSEKISFSGKSFINQGKISANDEVSIWASDFVGNEFGGEITAKTVRAVSENGLFRNGSRAPYKPALGHTPIADHSAVSGPSGIEGGMYYLTDHSSIANKVKASSTSAIITANDIYITSSAFENVNPYWSTIDYGEPNDLEVPTGHVVINRQIGNGVQITANNNLIVDSDQYAYNSSAIMQVLSPKGKIQVDAGVVNNERYRRMNLLSESNFSDTKSITLPCPPTFCGIDNPYATTTTTVDTHNNNLYSRSYIFSPPGRIFSAGEMSITASSSVINNVSYIEVLKNIKINSGTILQIGHKNRGISDFELLDQNQGLFQFNTTTGTDIVNHTSQDALFKVGGKLYAPSSSFVAKNTDAFKEYINLAYQKFVDAIPVETNSEFTIVGDLFCSPVIHGNCEPARFVAINRRIVSNIDDVTSGYEEGLLSDISISVTSSTDGAPATTTYSTEKSLWDLVKEYYEDIKDYLGEKITELQNELNWWE